MSSIVLSSVGSVVGAAVGGPIGGKIGGYLASQAGSFFENSLFGSNQSSSREGARLDDLAVQTSTYGKSIPIVFGSVRMGGNVIWSLPIREVATTTTTTQSGGKGGGGGSRSSSSTQYSYFVSIAIAVCEGEVDSILRVWADSKQLDTSQGTYRFYTGSEEQLPDSLIESFEGIGATPAYRGMAYVVIEDFPLADYGNRIPNFTFEVQNKTPLDDPNETPVEEMVTGITLIPGSGEFVYDTQVAQKYNAELAGGRWIQRGQREILNAHTGTGKANAEVAVEQMIETMPNLEWVGVVINWFGDDLNAGQCDIFPAVETSNGFIDPDGWHVAGQTRGTARRITYDGERPRYGGTPDDDSIVRLCELLRSKGLKVFAYPMLLMDVAGKPWRGTIRGSAADAANFFTKAQGYNAFIMHYANLLKDKVDAFTIGTEMVQLNKITEVEGVYPAVDGFVSLAASVKSVMGAATKITYAADWSEYHHTDGGWYHLDPLWMSDDIDFIGIDAYFPLTNGSQNGYDVQDIIDGWDEGEGYEFYYTDGTRTTTSPLGAAYAWKNIDWWWGNEHWNPNGQKTPWVPQAKKIWFTEYGFPSVDGAANQPNVFYDPATGGSSFPYFSKGVPDRMAQRVAIEGTERRWENSDMVEQKFLWTWDARPYPQWPDLTEVWSDGVVWERGHWVQGKFGLSSLSAVVHDLLTRAGLNATQINASGLPAQIDGYLLERPMSVRNALESLMQAYHFDMVESGGVLKVVPRGGEGVEAIDTGICLPQDTRENGDPIYLEITRQQEHELPQQVEVQYLNRFEKYQTGTARAQRLTSLSQEKVQLSVPLVLSELDAFGVAEKMLRQAWMGREVYRFSLPQQFAYLEPGDVISLSQGATNYALRISRIQYGKPGVLRVSAIAEDASIYRFDAAGEDAQGSTERVLPTAETALELLDIPALSNDGAEDSYVRISMTGLASHWTGAGLYRADTETGDYTKLIDTDSSAIAGAALDVLGDADTAVFDEVNSVTVNVAGAEGLVNASKDGVLNGANAALLGDEVIQFMNAEELAENQYRLSGLLRGRLGTEHSTAAHAAGERFVMLDNRLRKETMPQGLWDLPRYYKAVTFGQSLNEVTPEVLSYGALALKPYAPVHGRAQRDDGGNLDVSWIRRTRVGGSWRSGVDVPLSEAFEAYEVEVFNGDEVVRMLNVATPNLTYSAAQQIEDFGAVQETLTLRIYQMSEKVGRGHALEIEV